MDTQDLTLPEERQWYAQQERLLQYIESDDPALWKAGLQLFLEQHAQLHSTEGKKSFADSILEGLSDEDWRLKLPDKNSIAWLIWHNARIEDTTFNLLVLGKSQIYDEWRRRLGCEANGCLFITQLSIL